jgi:predicted signal transduction protein with EAL and GGDEF domain
MQALLVGRKLVRVAAQEVPFAGQTWRVGASVGIAVSPDDGSDVAALLKSADTAMYAAKRAGKGACHFAQAQRQAELERQLALETALRRALERGELALALEPVVELASGRVVAHRATLRWRVDGEAVAVQPVVDGSDDPALVEQVDRWLLTQACRAAARETVGGVAVTLAAAAAGMAELPALVRDVLAEAGLPPQRLLLQFPARHLAEPHRSLDVPSRLRGQGVRIGFCGVNGTDLGLQRLVMAPVDQLEVDARAQAGTPYIRALASLGQQLGYVVAAVGLDTAAQRQWAEAAGCVLGTGAACPSDVAA